MEKRRALNRFLVVLVLVLTSNFAKAQQYTIGALYDGADEALYKSFRAAVKRANEAGIVLLKAISFKTQENDILGCDAAKKLRDVSCIFDLSFGSKRSYALAELLRVPMVTLKPIIPGTPLSQYVFTLGPPEETMAGAMVKLSEYYMKKKYKKVAVVVERKKTHLGARIFSLAQESKQVTPYMMPEVIAGNYKETQKAFTVLLRSRITFVILVCDPKDTQGLLETALRVACINEYSRWLTPNMEIPGNISALALRGLVGLRLYATGTRRLKREAEKNGPKTGIPGLTFALLNDSVFTVALALKEMNQVVDKPKLNKDCPIRSSSTTKQDTVLNVLHKVKMQGSTGSVSFKRGTKERNVEKFTIVNIKKSNDGLNRKYKMGNLTVKPHGYSVTLDRDGQIDWNGAYWKDLQCDRISEKLKSPDEKDRVIKVITKVDEPFMMYVDNYTSKTGNDRFQGFSKSLLDLLAKKINVQYEIVISQEKSYGSVQDDGQWGGIIGEVIRQEADMCIGPITITAEREDVIDFSKPFLDFRIAMILQKPLGEEVNLFAFLQPFQQDLWLTTCSVVGMVTLFMWILDRFSPYGYRAEAKATGEGDGNEFSISNSLWFATGSILQQGGDNTPRSGSGRVLAAAFWLFTLILISTYTANLAAFFTAKNTKSSINSLDDLAAQDEYKFGVQQGGSLYTFFKYSKVRLYKKMFGKMKTLNSFVNGTSYGVRRARTSKYAYLTDQPSLDFYNNQEPCNTMLIKNLLDAKSYALGLQRNSEWTNKISVAILKLREEGEVESIRKEWWDKRSKCPPDENAGSSPQRLELHHLAGVFIILGGGAAISLALLVAENRCKEVFSWTLQ